MNKTTEALKIADLVEASVEECMGDDGMVAVIPLDLYNELIEALSAIRETLAEPVKQELNWGANKFMPHEQPVKRPQNCGTGYCSCIECPYEPVKQEPVCECRRKTEVVIESERLL